MSIDAHLQAWRAVDRAYYDKQFNGKPWFKVRSLLVLCSWAHKDLLDGSLLMVLVSPDEGAVSQGEVNEDSRRDVCCNQVASILCVAIMTR